MTTDDERRPGSAARGAMQATRKQVLAASRMARETSQWAKDESRRMWRQRYDEYIKYALIA